MNPNISLLLRILERLWPPLRTRRVHLEAAWSHYRALEALLSTAEQKQRFMLFSAELQAAMGSPPRGQT